jgi:hypothetical protein
MNHSRVNGRETISDEPIRRLKIMAAKDETIPRWAGRWKVRGSVSPHSVLRQAAKIKLQRALSW